MKGNMEERAERLALYIIENRTTVRAAAAKFGISKSTVHKDISERLPLFNRALYLQVKEVLDVNKAQIKLIDRYEISIYAAKTLMSYKLHESMEPGTVAQARRPELEAALKSARDKAAAAGCTLNDRFEYEKDGKPVTAGEIGAAGAMTALLKDALDPNLVQTLENNPAIIHGGPFANIAHGCNSVMATKLSLSLADYVITEAGFGADLGAEKFLDIKCRYAGIAPSACVLVATVRALKSHGGVAKADLNQPNLEAVKAGASNLVRHIDNLKNGFGLPVVVAINAFPTDTPEEQAYVEQVCAEQGVPCVLSEVFAKGGEGGKALAEKVLEVMEDRPIQYVYPLEMPLKQKVEAIAKKIYRADGVNFSAAASKTLAELTELGYGDLPVCIAKTQYSFSDNAKLTGAPTGFTMEVREVRLAAGAGFVVVICGNIMTMPGLPKKPAAVNIDVDAEGKITGLF